MSRSEDRDEVGVYRINADEVGLAQQMFGVLWEVFREADARLSDQYVASLLGRDDFVAMVAVDDGQPVGGLTAHVLPMTRSQTSELFIYDLAVLEAYQRRGHATRLIHASVEFAADRGMSAVFVPADNDDVGAIDFYGAVGGRGTAVTIFDLGAD